ncbi:type IV secretion system protein VirB3 [Agrobacterium tumefaciens]|uniref:type IV secretion system protein VirB3 n=1 Tax=Agrobacterium tumefaciens TaxID=358 RepID=UPI0021D36BF2|nr:VirB3 family type IV secretion system protein [Agrobacterium tumefaciens]UXS05572.1 type VI secretion protein [Agrobacterium tumefaciens]
MVEQAKPQVAPLVIGLTRPRMMWGIPIGLFVGELMIVVMVFLNTKNLAVFLLFFPLHATAFMMTVRDPHLASIFRVRIAKCPLTKNRHFWAGNSYQP